MLKEQALELRKKMVADEEALRIQEKQKVVAEELAKQKQAAEELATAQKKAADEAERANQKRMDEAKRIADIRQNEIDRLKEEKILLTEGAEAAKQFHLEQQGVDKDSAARLAQAQTQIDELRKDADGPSSVSIGQQAVQSRLLTRGPAEKASTRSRRARRRRWNDWTH